MNPKPSSGHGAAWKRAGRAAWLSSGCLPYLLISLSFTGASPDYYNVILTPAGKIPLYAGFYGGFPFLCAWAWSFVRKSTDWNIAAKSLITLLIAAGVYAASVALGVFIGLFGMGR